MGVRVAVAGASGYAGGELLRLILGHPSLELGPVAAGTSSGAPVTSIHPQLPDLVGHALGPADPDLLGSADLVFLALPQPESAALAAALPSQAAIVDLSASFRLADPGDWASYYPTPHAGTWTYGLPELPGAPPGGWPAPAATPPRPSSRSRHCLRQAWPTPGTS
jgi:N-acetyl-gamma-glutamyl-phosphate reductase